MVPPHPQGMKIKSTSRKPHSRSVVSCRFFCNLLPKCTAAMARQLRFVRDTRAVFGNAAKVFNFSAINSKNVSVGNVRYGILPSSACLYSVEVDPEYRDKGLATYLRYRMCQHAIEEEKVDIIHRGDWTEMGERRFSQDAVQGQDLFRDLEQRVMKRHGSLTPEYPCLTMYA